MAAEATFRYLLPLSSSGGVGGRAKHGCHRKNRLNMMAADKNLTTFRYLLSLPPSGRRRGRAKHGCRRKVKQDGGGQKIWRRFDTFFLSFFREASGAWRVNTYSRKNRLNKMAAEKKFDEVSILSFASFFRES